MRKILVVDGHPDPARAHLNHALADIYAQTALELGHQVRRINVAEIEFPMLRSSEEFETGTPVEAILSAQDDVRWADHFTFFYPLWVGDMPALLKAFLEQTLRPGVALRNGRRFPKPLLKGKSARIVVTMGMPAFFYKGVMGAHSVKALESTLTFAGVGPVYQALFGGVGEFNESKARACLARAAALAKEDGAGFGRVRGIPVRAATLGVAALAGYAAYTVGQWARYGVVQRAENEDELLDRVMPDYEVRIRQGVTVDAPVDSAFDAICGMDFRRLPALVNALFKTREIVLHAGRADQPLPEGLLDQLAAMGWMFMPDSSAREVVIVSVTQPWQANPVFRGLQPGEFARFNEPGYAKIALALRTDPTSEQTCYVQTETRVKTTDPESRALFRRYWALVAPGIAIVRMALLQHVKREAESKVRITDVEFGTVSAPDPDIVDATTLSS